MRIRPSDFVWDKLDRLFIDDQELLFNTASRLIAVFFLTVILIGVLLITIGRNIM
ncbi:hypothetical protein [Flavobacterium yafengii]|uniref:hypothetical protein n=1 Tax=Flavobacterium yafengii TaxID=3041253 RepID=UPI0024A9EC57|nr:hypothetical protein [Flavobacterium yafengii]MDI5896892.1 hypothetical protein [Flavobacterium yafengii]